MGRKIFVLIISLFLLISCNTRAKKEAMQSYEKGKELGMQGKFEEALQMFNHAIKIYPDLPEAHNGAGFAYFNMKKYKEAEEEFLKAIKLKNDYIKPYNSLGDMYFAKGELAKAIEVWEKYLNIDPNVAELHAKVGQAKMSEASGQHYNMNAALEHLQKAVNINPTNSSFRLLLADCYQHFKEFLPNSITEYNTI